MRENKLADRDAAKNIGFRGENLCGGISEKQRIRNFGEKFSYYPSAICGGWISSRLRGTILSFWRSNADGIMVWFSAAYALNQAQQQRILAAAQVYLYRHPTRLQPRFRCDLYGYFFWTGFFLKCFPWNTMKNAFGLW